MLAEIPAIRNWSALVVDDAQAMRGIMRTLLRGLGISAIKEAGDGSRAIEILDSHRVDLVISDLVMSPMDGLAMTRLIRRPNLRYAFVPILMVSGQCDEQSIKQALTVGVTDFLVKPLTPNALAARIQAIVTRPRQNVKTKDYWGPERRRRAMWVKIDRRENGEWT